MTDARLRSQVEQRLLTDVRTRDCHLTVQVQAAVVILAGRTPSPETREAAAQIARGTPGARDVANRITTRNRPRSPGLLIALATGVLLVPFVVTSRWVGAAILAAAGVVLADLLWRRRRPAK
ncbi:BON domain-containing protein [Actinoplanes sp. LDG1-06]|uniref:BON domain-containing protein n=1 Tax=Paractinoplanes ovalisporus TaxID=2810368 RepID=A0ABS2A4X7_9ACTN|nr:BON domain-containing protein [Actinoplanes ovalisporus]MBM2614874.1 BON domain-containing protein [Actinoplanes ovalisporus]